MKKDDLMIPNPDDHKTVRCKMCLKKGLAAKLITKRNFPRHILNIHQKIKTKTTSEKMTKDDFRIPTHDMKLFTSTQVRL